MQPVVVENISRKYNQVQALKNVNFTVNKNELFGLIGPDGAGKTTMFRILTSLLLPTEGSATMMGHNVVKDYKQVRNIIGYMPGRFSLYQDLSVLENLTFFATVFGTTIEENYDLIADIYSHIEPFKHRKAGALSGGMKQKLALSCALIHKPDILLLDEPTTGVDAVSRKEFWEMLKKLQQKNITILVSTPYMDEANLCDRVALIQKGEIMQVDTPENIVRQFNKPLFSVQSDSIYKMLNALREAPFAHSVFAFGQSVHLATNNTETTENQIVEYLNKQSLNNIKTSTIQANIEDCFMDLMQE